MKLHRSQLLWIGVLFFWLQIPCWWLPVSEEKKRETNRDTSIDRRRAYRIKCHREEKKETHLGGIKRLACFCCSSLFGTFSLKDLLDLGKKLGFPVTHLFFLYVWVLQWENVKMITKIYTKELEKWSGEIERRVWWKTVRRMNVSKYPCQE